METTKINEALKSLGLTVGIIYRERQLEIQTLSQEVINLQIEKEYQYRSFDDDFILEPSDQTEAKIEEISQKIRAKLTEIDRLIQEP